MPPTRDFREKVDGRHPPERTPKFLTRKEVPLYYPVSYHTLAYWASRGDGPPFRRAGKNSIYESENLDRFFSSEIVDLKPRMRRRRR